MFNILSKGLRKKGQGGTSRLLGDVEHTVWFHWLIGFFAVIDMQIHCCACLSYIFNLFFEEISFLKKGIVLLVILGNQVGHIGNQKFFFKLIETASNVLTLH